MRILFITHSLTGGGAERVMTTLANSFSELKYHVTILSKINEPSFYFLNPDITIFNPKNVINYSSKISTTYSRIKNYLEILGYIKQNQFDVVIPFSTATNGVIILICKYLGIPVIASEHTNYRANQNSFSNIFIRRYIYRLANYITVLTKRDKEEYYDKYMKNIVVMPNPLPIQPLDDINSKKREKVIIAIGKLSRWKIKGFDNLVEIFSSISKEYPDWKLCIAGRVNSDVIQNKITQMNLNDKIEFIGEISNIADLMKHSSIFALTSRWEGLPMSLLEAMSQGMACIAFDCFTGPGELITNEKDGILIEDQNNAIFSNQLRKLVNKPKFRKDLGIEAIKTSNKYNSSVIVQKWIDLFTKISN